MHWMRRRRASPQLELTLRLEFGHDKHYNRVRNLTLGREATQPRTLLPLPVIAGARSAETMSPPAGQTLERAVQDRPDEAGSGRPARALDAFPVRDCHIKRGTGTATRLRSHRERMRVNFCDTTYGRSSSLRLPDVPLEWSRSEAQASEGAG